LPCEFPVWAGEAMVMNRLKNLVVGLLEQGHHLGW